MKLTPKDIKQFQKLYKKYFGVNLPTDQAQIKLSSLVNQMQVIYRPITEQQLSNLKNRDSEDMNKDYEGL